MLRHIGVALAFVGLSTTAQAKDFTQIVTQLEHCQDYGGTCLGIDVSDRTVTLFQRGKAMETFDVAVGKPGWRTPIGNHYVFEMGRNVNWLDLYTGKPSTQNPMLGQWIGYARYDDDVRVGFHPTEHVNSVGQPSSHGCNRMRLADFNQLYAQIAKAKTMVPVLVRQ